MRNKIESAFHQNEYGDGISVRDWFAGRALQSLLSTITEYPDEKWREGLAIDAYMMADAMMKERHRE